MSKCHLWKTTMRFHEHTAVCCVCSIYCSLSHRATRLSRSNRWKRGATYCSELRWQSKTPSPSPESLSVEWSAKRHFCHTQVELLNVSEMMPHALRKAIHLSVPNSRTGRRGDYTAKVASAISSVDYRWWCWGKAWCHNAVQGAVMTSNLCYWCGCHFASTAGAEKEASSF